MVSENLFFLLDGVGKTSARTCASLSCVRRLHRVVPHPLLELSICAVLAHTRVSHGVSERVVGREWSAASGTLAAGSTDHVLHAQ